jgi:hypothetical protein
VTGRRLRLLPLALALAAFAHSQGGPPPSKKVPPAPVMIEIQAAAKKIISGRGFVLRLTLINLLPGRLAIRPEVNYFRGGPGPFDLSVTGPGGGSARLTSFSRWLEGLGHPTATLTFPGGGRFSSEVVVTSYFDMTLTGRYTLRASLFFPHSGPVFSNVLTVEVTASGALPHFQRGDNDSRAPGHNLTLATDASVGASGNQAGGAAVPPAEKSPSGPPAACAGGGQLKNQGSASP